MERRGKYVDIFIFNLVTVCNVQTWILCNPGRLGNLQDPVFNNVFTDSNRCIADSRDYSADGTSTGDYWSLYGNKCIIWKEGVIK